MSFWKETTCSIFTVAIFHNNIKRNLTRPQHEWQPTVFVHKSSHLALRSSSSLKVFCSVCLQIPDISQKQHISPQQIDMELSLPSSQLNSSKTKQFLYNDCWNSGPSRTSKKQRNPFVTTNHGLQKISIVREYECPSLRNLRVFQQKEILFCDANKDDVFECECEWQRWIKSLCSFYSIIIWKRTFILSGRCH